MVFEIEKRIPERLFIYELADGAVEMKFHHEAEHAWGIARRGIAAFGANPVTYRYQFGPAFQADFRR